MIATLQIIDLRLTLRYLGVPLNDKAYMFGDNKSVVDSTSRPHAKLHKRHTALSFNRVREAIASKMLCFTFIHRNINPADILSKHWSNHKVWPMLQYSGKEIRWIMLLIKKPTTQIRFTNKWGVTRFPSWMRN